MLAQVAPQYRCAPVQDKKKSHSELQKEIWGAKQLKAIKSDGNYHAERSQSVIRAPMFSLKCQGAIASSERQQQQALSQPERKYDKCGKSLEQVGETRRTCQIYRTAGKNHLSRNDG
jgi:hypothetical protein